MPADTTIIPPLELAARWTLTQYVELIETGILNGRRVELIAGQITEMSPASAPHDACISILSDWLRDRISDEATIREQMGIQLPDADSLPEPDIAVVTRRRDAYAENKPEAQDVALLIEVSVSSLQYDREVKAPLYSSAEIEEYWIVNLANRQLERYLPAGENEAYGDPQIYEEGATFEHQLWGRVVIADLLPMRVNGAS